MKHLLLTTIAAVVLVGTAFADPIHEAAANGDLAGVQAELDKGADVNAKDEQGYTPLHNAAWEGHKEIAELFFAAGANVNAKNGLGFTPLHQAAASGHKEIVVLESGRCMRPVRPDWWRPRHIPPSRRKSYANGEALRVVCRSTFANGLPLANNWKREHTKRGVECSERESFVACCCL